MGVLLILLLLLLLLIGVPVAISLGGSALVILLMDGYNLTTTPQKIFEGLSGYTLLAIPFFILAGNLMSSGGIAKRIISFTTTLVKWITGGIGMSTILTTMIFSTISGSSSATTAAIGSIMVPNMEKRSYAKNFSAALCAASGELGAIIPPSIVIIVFSMSSGTSISQMFMAAIIPGAMAGIFLIIANYLYVKSRSIDKGTKINVRVWLKEVFVSFKESFLALLMPVIILGGIYTGIFSPTEVSVLAVLYALILGVFVYKELKLKDVFKVIVESAVSTSVIMVIISFATIFSYVLTINQIPHNVAMFFTGLTDNIIIFLLLINLLLLVAGMFFEAFSAIIILTPILMPVAMEFGIDPLHFGVIMIINLAIGMITPPIGVNLFIISEVVDIPVVNLIKPALFLISILIINLLIITFIPELATWLPSLLK